LVAGVATGLAEHLGVPTLWVRIAFVLLSFASGAGLLAYAAFWVVVPLAAPGEPGAPASVEESSPTRDDSQRDLLVLLGVGAVAVGAASLASRGGFGSGFLVPLMVAGVGVAVLWRQSDDAQRTRWRSHATRAAGGRGKTRWARLGLGVALVVLGLVAALATTGDLVLIADGLAAAAILLVGAALVAGPWLLRLVRERGEERRELVRTQERAEIAAHVHDSVLQTLTLIQRNADDPSAVARLARAEERALRSWLYRPPPTTDATFVPELERFAGEVEDTYAVTLEVVTVGDVGVSPPVAALLQATREAMVNAAKHAGAAAPVAVFAEAGADGLEVFVRDRGPGFDLDRVADDRLGVSQSIVGRMERHGGRADIRSSADGTEVRLTLPGSALAPTADSETTEEVS
jgi:signal transduction histidine kinase/phage shock protein PspC (stress-responsive transcriptional regulator)